MEEVSKETEDHYRENNWPLVQVSDYENVERSISIPQIGPLEIETMIKGRRALDQRMISINKFTDEKIAFNFKNILFEHSKKLVRLINKSQERIYGLENKLTA